MNIPGGILLRVSMDEPGDMTVRPNQSNHVLLGTRRLQLRAGRSLSMLIVAGALLILGFYTVTDSGRLAHSQVLDGADWVGYAVCHRITSRSFTINGRQLALCARCTGMYLGVMVTFVVLALAGRLRRSELPSTPMLLLLAGFVAVMGIDGINSYLHFFPNAPHAYEPKNWLRLLTGMGTGLAMGLLVFPALAQTLWQHRDVRSNIDSWREFAGMLLVAGLVVMLVLSNQPTILYVLALTSAAGVLLIVSAIQTVLILVLIRRDGRATSWKQTLIPLLSAFVLTILEIALVGAARFNLTGTMTGFPGL